MKKIYLDTNIYNRPYDDQLQVRIRLETISIFEILKKVQSKALPLVWSFILDYENSLNPYEDIRTEIEMLSPLAFEHINASEDIRQLAKQYAVKGIKPRDALHLACAIKAKADYFITCDDNIIRKSKGIDISIKIINPVDFLRVWETNYENTK